MTHTLGAELAAALADEGVTVAFGIPGTHNLGLYAHLGAAGIRHVTPRHEQGGGYAADGYARVSGRPGVVITTTGPGILNAASALAQSWSDSVPVLAITPCLPTWKREGQTGYLHETRDQTTALTALLGDVRRVDSATEARWAVQAAFAGFAHGRRRPAVIEVPLDLFDLPSEPVGRLPKEVPTEVRPSEVEIDEAAELLAGAHSVGIVVGGGARAAVNEVRRLVSLLDAPVVATVNGRGVVDERSRLHLAATIQQPTVRRWLESCDAVLVIGSELAHSDTYVDEPLRLHGLVRIDVDPAQAALNSYEPDVFLQGDVLDIAPRLADALERLGAHGPDPDRPEPEVLEQTALEAGTRALPYLPLLQGMRSALPDDAILCTDNAMVVYDGAHAGFPVYHPGTYLFPAGLGTLGYALPAAIGAAVAADEGATLPGFAGHRPVAVLSGDGGFQFTLPELATARTLNRPLPIVVVDNGGYGEIRKEMLARGDDPVGVAAVGPDLVELARAYDLPAVRLSAGSGDPAVLRQVHSAVDAALTLDRPMLIVVPEDGRPGPEADR